LNLKQAAGFFFLGLVCLMDAMGCSRLGASWRGSVGLRGAG
jgi:hypothetical protein